jgi:hypothetical protein
MFDGIEERDRRQDEEGVGLLAEPLANRRLPGHQGEQIPVARYKVVGLGGDGEIDVWLVVRILCKVDRVPDTSKERRTIGETMDESDDPIRRQRAADGEDLLISEHPPKFGEDGPADEEFDGPAFRQT